MSVLVCCDGFANVSQRKGRPVAVLYADINTIYERRTLEFRKSVIFVDKAGFKVQ